MAAESMETVPAARGHLALLRAEPAFRRLLLASFISGIGDWFNSVAVLGLVLRLTGTGLAVGITLALRVLPFLVAGPLGGWLADRLPRKVILVSADLVRVGLALIFLLATTPGRVWLVFAGTLGLMVFSVLYNPARQAALPSLVQPQHLLGANALEETVFGSRMVLGAVLGGLAVAAWGANVAFVLNALSFLLSALLTLRIRFPALTRPERAAGKSTRGVWAVLRGSRVVRLVALLSVLWPVGGGVVNVLLSVYALQVFHAGDVGTGIMYGALGLGFILGGTVAPRFARWMRQGAAVGFVLEGAGHTLCSQAPGLAVAALCLTLATLGGAVGNACVNSLVMQAVPADVRGRVFALFDSLSGGCMGLSMLVGGMLVGVVAPRSLGLGAGLLVLLASLICGALLWRTETA